MISQTISLNSSVYSLSRFSKKDLWSGKRSLPIGEGEGRILTDIFLEGSDWLFLSGRRK